MRSPPSPQASICPSCSRDWLTCPRLSISKWRLISHRCESLYRSVKGIVIPEGETDIRWWLFKCFESRGSKSDLKALVVESRSRRRGVASGSKMVMESRSPYDTCINLSWLFVNGTIASGTESGSINLKSMIELYIVEEWKRSGVRSAYGTFKFQIDEGWKEILASLEWADGYLSLIKLCFASILLIKAGGTCDIYI